MQQGNLLKCFFVNRYWARVMAAQEKYNSLTYLHSTVWAMLKCFYDIASQQTHEKLLLQAFKKKSKTVLWSDLPFLLTSFSGTKSVTRLGNFWKFLATNFLTIEAQIFDDSLGYFIFLTF